MADRGLSCIDKDTAAKDMVESSWSVDNEESCVVNLVDVVEVVGLCRP